VTKESNQPSQVNQNQVFTKGRTTSTIKPQAEEESNE
jgi:hypothetical protein